MQKGFTLIELLIVIAIIGILASLILGAVSQSRDKAFNARIRNDVVQLRWLAEIAYDQQGGSYQNFTSLEIVQDQLSLLREDIDENYGDPAGSPYQVTIQDSQVQNYCVSAPLRNKTNQHFCIDNSGLLVTTTSACANYAEDETPLGCSN